jgi:hypothetical protein
LIAELFGWFGLGQAVKDFEKSNRKGAMVLLGLFFLMLMGILIYITYRSIRFFTTH